LGRWQGSCMKPVLYVVRCSLGCSRRGSHRWSPSTGFAHRTGFDGSRYLPLLLRCCVHRSSNQSRTLFMPWFDTLQLMNPRMLLKAGTDTVVLRLAAFLLKSPDPRMRCKGVENLSASSDPNDTELIFASLQDDDPQVRISAVRVLAKTNKPGAD